MCDIRAAIGRIADSQCAKAAMTLFMLGVLTLTITSCYSLDLEDGITPSKDQESSPEDLLSLLYSKITSEQIEDLPLAKWDKNLTQERNDVVSSHCIKLIAKKGINSSSECELYVTLAVKHCKKLQETAAVMENGCHELLNVMDPETNSVTRKKRAKKHSKSCIAPGSCLAGEICGYTPGQDSDKTCMWVYKKQESNTQQTMFKIFKEIPTSNSKSQAEDAVLVRVYTIPIGQGDCNIIKCNEGENVVIFDCGSHNSANNIFGSNPKLLQSFFKMAKFVTVLVSHGHRDHYNLIERVLTDDIKKGIELNVLVGGKASDYKWVTLKKVEVFSSSSITQYDFCNSPNIVFEILAAGNKFSGENQRGMVMKLSCEKCGSQLLFPGDMEGDAAEYLAENYGSFLQSSHYKMAHHGASLHANHKEWLEAISPVEVHISHKYIYGKYYHPRCDAINRLMEVGSVGLASEAEPVPFPHDITCFFNDGSSLDQQVYHRVYNTAPRKDKICLIVMTFKVDREATTEYFCDDPKEFLKIADKM